jgi:hypothetical protein
MRGQLRLILTAAISIGAPILRGCLGFNLAHRSASPQHIQCSRRFATATKLVQRATSNSESASQNRTVRILCLHGKGGNGNVFTSRALAPLRSLLDSRLGQMNAEHKVLVEWDALTAPFEIPSTKATSEEERGYSWWSMPPGVRSFNAEEVSEIASRTLHAHYSPVLMVFMLHS